MGTERHSFHINTVDNQITIPHEELSIHVGTFDAALKNTGDVRKAVMDTLKSAWAQPTEENGRITITRQSGQGKPTILQWMEERGIISGYEMRDENGNVIMGPHVADEPGTISMQPETDKREEAA